MYDFDARPQVRNIIIGWTLRFDDILDAEKLSAALSRLLEIGDWRKLGGRLRETVRGQRRAVREEEENPKALRCWRLGGKIHERVEGLTAC